MANIDRVVNVQISFNTAGLTEAGFSTMLVAGWHAYTNERVITVTSESELLDYGFKTDDKIYIAVADAMRQIPRPRIVKVGRLQCSAVRVKFKGSVIPNNMYMLDINTITADGSKATQTYTYMANEEDTAVDVLTNIAQGVSGAYSASVVGDIMYIKSVNNKTFVVDTYDQLEVDGFTRADISIAENMADIVKADSDFYGVILASRDSADILEMADWVEGQTKIFLTSISEEGAKNAEVTSDTGSKLMLNNYFRTSWSWHEDAENEYADAAEMARCFAIEPGGETWANKKLNGIKSDYLSEGEYQAITKKNGNTYEKFRNVSITQNGKVASGEWIDVIRFRDWLIENIRTEEFTMLINKDKLPYTDAGISIVELVLNTVLKKGQDRGGIAPTEYDDNGNKILGYVITMPKSSDISVTTKASRVLTDISFTARLAGAIHVIEIKGSLTYDNLIEG